MSQMKKRYIVLVIFVAMTSLLVFGCKKKEKKPTVINAQEIVFKYDEGQHRLPLIVGAELDLTELITVNPENTTDPSYTITSRDETIVKVEDKTIKALTKGSTYLTIRATSNKDAVESVKVDIFDQKQTLSSPVNLRYNNQTSKLTFDPTDNAIKYVVSLLEEGKTESVDYEINNTELDVTDKILSGKIYSAKVKAIAPTTYGDVFNNSEFSNAYKFCVFKDVENLTFNNSNKAVSFTDNSYRSNLRYLVSINEAVDGYISSSSAIGEHLDTYVYDVAKLIGKPGNEFVVKIVTSVSDECKANNQDVAFFDSVGTTVDVYVLDAPTNLKFKEETYIENSELKIKSRVYWVDVKKPDGVQTVFYKLTKNNVQLTSTTDSYFDTTDLLTNEDKFNVEIDISRISNAMCRESAASITVFQAAKPTLSLTTNSVKWEGESNEFCCLILDKDGDEYKRFEQNYNTSFSFANSGGTEHLPGEYSIKVYQKLYRPVGSGSEQNTYYRTSDVATMSFQKRGISESDVIIENRVFKINAPVGEYQIECKKTTGQTIYNEKVSTKQVDEESVLEIDFSDSIQVSGEYVISVKPYGDGKTTLDGESKSVKRFVKYSLEEVSISNSSVDVNHNADNDSAMIEYKIYQTKDENNVEVNNVLIFTNIVDKNHSKFSINTLNSDINLPSGKYFITVKFVGDESSSFSTRETDRVNATEFVVLNSPILTAKDLGDSASVVITENSALTRADNFILYNENKNVVVESFEKGNEDSSVEYNFSINSSQEFTFMAQAIGNGGNLLSSTIITFDSPFVSEVYYMGAENNKKDNYLSSITIKRLPFPEISYDRVKNAIELSTELDETTKSIKYTNKSYINENFSYTTEEIYVPDWGGGLIVGDNSFKIQYLAIGYDENKNTDTNQKIINTKFYINSFETEICVHKLDKSEITLTLDTENVVTISNNESDVDVNIYFSFDESTKYCVSEQTLFDNEKFTTGYKVKLVDSATYNAKLENLNGIFKMYASVFKTSTSVDNGVKLYYADSDYAVSEEFLLNKLLVTATDIKTNTENEIVVSSPNTKKEKIDLYINDTLFKDDGNYQLVQCDENEDVVPDGATLSYEYLNKQYIISGVYENIENLGVAYGNFNVRVKYKKTVDGSDMDSDWSRNYILTYLEKAKIERQGQEIVFTTSQIEQHEKNDYAIYIKAKGADYIISGSELTDVKTTETYKSYKISADAIFDKAGVKGSTGLVEVQLKALNARFNTALYSISEVFYMHQATAMSNSDLLFNEPLNGDAILTIERELTAYNKEYYLDILNKDNDKIGYKSLPENTATAFEFNLTTYEFVVGRDEDEEIDIFSKLTAGKYTVNATVFAQSAYELNGKNIYVFNSSAVATIEFSKLRTPVLTESGDGVEINSDTDVSYEVQCSYDGKPFETLSTEVLANDLYYTINGNKFELKNVEDGVEYIIRVRALFDGAKINSDFSDEITLKRLSAPTISVENSQAIVKLPANIADLYSTYNIKIKLTGENSSHEADLSVGGNTNTEIGKQGFSWKGTNIVLGGSVVNGVLGTGKEATTKSVKAELIFDLLTPETGTKVYLNTSQSESTISRLAAPTGLTMDKINHLVKWDVVQAREGVVAEKYTMYINSKATAGIVTNSCEFSETTVQQELVAGSYRINVYATHSEYLTSVSSDTFTYTILPKTALSVDENGAITWEGVPTSIGYNLVIYPFEKLSGFTPQFNEDPIAEIKFDGKLNVVFNFNHVNYISAGIYKITVQPLVADNDPTKENGEIYGDDEDELFMVYRLPETKEIAIDDGKLKIVGSPLVHTLRIIYNNGVEYIVDCKNPNFDSLGVVSIANAATTNANDTVYTLDIIHDLNLDISGTGYFTVQMIGGVSIQNYGLLNSKIYKAENDFTVTPSNQVENTPGGSKVVEDGVVKFKNVSANSVEMKYNFNNLVKVDADDFEVVSFWDSALVYEIEITANTVDSATAVKTSHQLTLYAVDYDKFMSAKAGLSKSNTAQTYYVDVVDKGRMVAYIVYQNNDGTSIYFNVYRDNIIDLQNEDYLYYYTALYQSVDNFKTEDNELKSLDTHSGGKFNISITTIAGDGLYLNAYEVTFDPIVRYQKNYIFAKDGQIKVSDLSQYNEDTELIDSPVYMFTFDPNDKEYRIIVFLYDAEKVTEENLKERYPNTFIKKYTGYDPTEQLNNVYWVPLELDADNDVLFDMGQHSAFGDGQYTVYVQTLVGSPVDSDSSNYVLNAREFRVDESGTVVNVLTKVQKVDSDKKGYILIRESYAKLDDGTNYYTNTYEIVIKSADGSVIFTKALEVGSECVYINEGLDHSLWFNITEIYSKYSHEFSTPLQSNTQYYINIRGMASGVQNTEINCINGNVLDEDISFTTTNVVSGVSVENGTLTVSGLATNEKYLIRVENAASVIYIKDVETDVYQFNDEGYDEFGSNLNVNLTDGYIYKISVAKQSGEDGYVNSLYSDEIICRRLPSVNRQLVKAISGILQWNPIEYATGYLVTVKSEDNTFYYTVVATEEQLEMGIVQLDFVNTAPDGETEMIAQGTYSISIRAIGSSQVINNGEDECFYLNSIITEAKVEFIKLNNVSNIIIHADKITWDAVANAEKYSVEFYHNEIPINSKVYTVNETSINIPESEEDGIYEYLSENRAKLTVKIKAVGNLKTNILNGNPQFKTAEKETASNVYDKLAFDLDNNRYLWTMGDDLIESDTIHFVYDFVEATENGNNQSVSREISFNPTVAVAEENFNEKIEYDSSTGEYSVNLSVIGEYNNVYIYVERAGAVNSYKAKIDNVNFKLFRYGAGTESSPYAISNEREFRNIEYFNNKQFSIVGGFNFGADEQLIEVEGCHNIYGNTSKDLSECVVNEFSGVLKGKENETVKIINLETELTDATEFALFRRLKGEISNIQLNARVTNKITVSGLEVKLSTIAVYAENATINNVYVQDTVIKLQGEKINKSYISGMIVDASKTTIDDSEVLINGLEICETKDSVFGGFVANGSELNLIDSVKNPGETKRNVEISSISIKNIGKFGGAVGTIENNSKVQDISTNINWSGITAITFGGVVAYADSSVVSLKNSNVTGSLSRSITKSGVSFEFGCVAGAVKNTKVYVDQAVTVQMSVSFNFSNIGKGVYIGKYVGVLDYLGELVGFDYITETSINNGSMTLSNLGDCGIDK